MVERLNVDRIREMIPLMQAEKILHYLEEGKTEVWIIDKLGLGTAEFQELKRLGLEAQIDAVKSKTSEEVYAEFLLQQSSCIRELTGLARDAYHKKDIKALVSAVKVRSDIYDKVIKMGQTLGVIEERPKRTEMMVGMVIADLSDEDLRTQIVGELSGLKQLQEQFDFKDILEVKPGRLHRKLPALPRGREPKTPLQANMSRGKRQRSVANKVHRGRRVVKG